MKQFVSLRHLFPQVWRPSEGRPRSRRLDPRRKKSLEYIINLKDICAFNCTYIVADV